MIIIPGPGYTGLHIMCLSPPASDDFSVVLSLTGSDVSVKDEKYDTDIQNTKRVNIPCVFSESKKCFKYKCAEVNQINKCAVSYAQKIQTIDVTLIHVFCLL